MQNLTNELHWKTANYLTKTFEVILIGNMSPKGIIRKRGNLNKSTKKLVSALNFYKFRQRLEFKCGICGCKYKIVDEYYTSKMCSQCGNINEKLGSSKVYNCKNVD